MFLKKYGYCSLIISYLIVFNCIAEDKVTASSISSKPETSVQKTDTGASVQTADRNMVSRHKLTPESDMEEDDVEEHEIVQPISVGDHINVILNKMYTDPRLSSKKITISMKNAEIKDVINMIGKSVGINFVVDSDVKGIIESINLKDYDAGQALQLIGKKVKPEAVLVRVGDVWHIMPRDEAKHAVADLMGKDQVYAVLPIKQANVDQQFSDKIKDVWKGIAHGDPDSYLHVDEDQKRIHVRSNRSAILELQRYIKEVDKPIMQVRIDVVIIAARKDFMFEFGFDWSGMYNREQTVAQSCKPFNFYGVGGTPLDFPNPKGKDSYTQAAPKPVVPSPPNTQNPNLFVNPLNFAINLFNSGASFFSTNASDTIVPGLIRIPFVFGGPDLSYKRLNVMLNMAETEEKISVISRPSILTSNNKIAKILIGQSIPLQMTTDEYYPSDTTKNRTATTINYKDTGIVLEVRPLVNPDKKSVYLNILVEESIVEAGSTRTNDKGIMTDPPVIAVIKTKNEVVLRNGQTTIIGGLSSRENSSIKRSVPFLSRIPLVGEFFKAQYESNKERERYIFITPKIVEYET